MNVSVSHSQSNRQEKQVNNDESIAFVIRAGYKWNFWYHSFFISGLFLPQKRSLLVLKCHGTHSLSWLRQFLIYHPLKIYLAGSFQAEFSVITTKQSIHVSDTMAANIK